MVRRLRTLALLRRGQRRAIERALVLACLAKLSLRFVPFIRLARWFGVRLAQSATPPRGDARAAAPLDERDRIDAWAVDLVFRRWPFSNRGCLARSLVLARLLRARGAVLRIGVARPASGLRAHAWVEIDGEAIGEHGVERFLPLRVSGTAL